MIKYLLFSFIFLFSIDSFSQRHEYESDYTFGVFYSTSLSIGLNASLNYRFFDIPFSLSSGIYKNGYKISPGLGAVLFSPHSGFIGYSVQFNYLHSFYTQSLLKSNYDYLGLEFGFVIAYFSIRTGPLIEIRDYHNALWHLSFGIGF